MGRDRFYLASQGRGLWPAILRSFASDTDVHRVVDNWAYALRERDNPKRSSGSHALFSDPELGGYGPLAPKSKVGDYHLPIHQQLRSAPLPLIDGALRTGPKRVVELGAGNGEFLHHLAGKYRDSTFTGVEFHTEYARQHQAPNLSWVAGYALDLLENGQIAGDILLASSTFSYVNPIELQAYVKAIKNARFQTVIIRDALIGGYDPTRYPNTFKHMMKMTFGYDYRHYFAQEGYKTTSFAIIEHSGQRSNRLKNQVLRLDLA